MKLKQILLMFMLGFSVSLSSAYAQLPQQPETIPPTPKGTVDPTTKPKPSAEEEDPDPNSDPDNPDGEPETSPTDGDEEKTAPPAEGEDKEEKEEELIIIRAPRMGGSSRMLKNLPPKLLEKLYKDVWQQISTQFIDHNKLGPEWIEWKTKYDGKLKTIEDLDQAVHAMTESLYDRWTYFISLSEIKQSMEQQKAGFISIGMIIRKHEDESYHIDGIAYGSPVKESVLKEGDLVKSINGKDLSKLTSHEVNALLAGKEGDKLTVIANWDGADHTVDLTFRKIEEDTVEVDLMPGKIGYIRLPTFMSDEIAADFVQKLGELYTGSNGQLNGLIIDLRNNSGGKVDLALKISKLFLEKGTVTTMRTRSNRDINDTSYGVMGIPDYLMDGIPEEIANFPHMLQTVPIALLINGSSASASEITTGALKDNGRAHVIGKHSFGKAVGYSGEPVDFGGYLQVTNLSYLTPNGTDIRDKGIYPHQEVDNERGSEDDLQLKAAFVYLQAIAKQRNVQLNDAKALATEQAAGENATRKAVIIKLSGAVVIMLGGMGFMFYVLKRSKRNRKHR